MQTILDISEVRNYFASHKDEILADLFSLVRIPSVRSEAEEGMPYGKESYRCLAASLKLFTDAGFDGEISADGSYALAYYGGNELAKSVALFAHTDVVPPGDGWKLTEPFAPIVYDGCVIGRGASDNKSGVITSLWILKYLKEKGIRPARPIAVFLGSAEESVMPDIKNFVREREMPYVSLVPDGSYAVCRGEKGIARFWLDATEPFEKITAFEGGQAPNVVLGLAKAAMPYEKELADALREKLGKRTDIVFSTDDKTITLCAKGLSAHASAPQSGINAANLLCAVLGTCEALPVHDREILKKAAVFLGQTDGSAANIAGCDGVFTPLSMANGMVALHDGKLSMCFDIRFDTHITDEVLERNIILAAEAYGFTTRKLRNDTGFLHPIDSKPLSVLLDVCEAYSGTRPKPHVMGGGTYARYLKNAYTVGTAVPYIPVSWTPEKGHGGAHQADERLRIAPFLESIAISTEMVMRLTEL